ncbi:MAG: glutamate--tRNA ligase [Leptospirales bacterium]|nr:glutamate--tRNA ligase [Leptospirales bacterium]
MTSPRIRTRFAPSPTGYLHIGGARTALFNFLYARSQGGDFIIRIEDTDQERSTPESEKTIMESLSWLGIVEDEGPIKGGPYAPYRQSERLDTYQRYVDQLRKKGQAYPCFCSDEELGEKQEKAKFLGLPYVYDGKCRSLSDEEIERRAAAGELYAIRFRVEPREISVDDAVQGKVKFDSRLIGDFIIVKSDGFPSYNFAVVVDDHEMKITHVIRGVGHLSNTPRQIMIHEALDLPLPSYSHISEIVGTDKKKLSKRRGAASVLFFRDLGYLSEALTNYMALLGWYPRDGVEYMPEGELARKFDVAQCSKSPAMFDFFLTENASEDLDPASLPREELHKYINRKSKLNWLNNRYLRETPVDKIWPLVLAFCQKDVFAAAVAAATPDKLRQSFESVRVYLDTLDELPAYVRELFKDNAEIADGVARAVLDEPLALEAVQAFVAVIGESKPTTPDGFSAAMKEAGKRSGAKGRGLFMPIRVASTASMQGLELPTLFSILGAEAVAERIRRVLNAAGLAFSG